MKVDFAFALFWVVAHFIVRKEVIAFKDESSKRFVMVYSVLMVVTYAVLGILIYIFGM